jgi:hypothetical protein
MTEEQFSQLLLDIGEIKRIVKDDHKAIRGNGQPGLIERVTRLETKVSIVAAVAGVVGSGILELIKHFF